MSWKSTARHGCVLSILISLVLIAGFFWLLDSGTTRTIYQRAASPDRWHEARVQFDDAGAVSSFSRLVFVKHDWNLSDEPLLSCRAFWGDGEAAVHLKWLNNRTLLIEHHFAPDAVKAVSKSCGPTQIVVRAVTPFEKN